MKQHNPGFVMLVEAAKARIRETDVETVKARLDAGESLHLIDVREDREWSKGHVPGASHMGRGILERDIETRFPALDTELILYCGGGYRSALAADNLQRMGYSKVSSMDGGFSGWVDAGYPITPS